MGYLEHLAGVGGAAPAPDGDQREGSLQTVVLTSENTHRLTDTPLSYDYRY